MGSGASQQAAAGGLGAKTKRPGALISNVALWAVGFLFLVVAAHSATASFGRRIGPYWSGALTLAVFIGVGLYSVRKRLFWISVRMMRLTARYARPLQNWLVVVDRLETWRAVHITVGVLALVPFWWHMETGLMGPLEAALAAAVALLFLSGFVGVFIQQYLPTAMTRRAEHEVRLKDVDARIRDVYVQAEEKILGHQEVLVQAYLQAIKPILLGSRPRLSLLWATLRGVDPGEGACREAAQLQPRVGAEAPAYRELLALAARKVNLEHNAFNLHLSTGWLVFHIVLSAAIAVLVIFHVFAVLYFAGT